MSKTITSFEFAAMRLLRQWVLHEADLHRFLANPALQPESPDSRRILRRALAYFKVSRSFKGISETIKSGKRYKVNADRKATAVLAELAGAEVCTADSVATEVKALATRWNEEGISKDKTNTSAASKLLWLRFQDPVVIYDQRDRDALYSHLALLGESASRKKLGNYDEYYRVWHTCYQHYRTRIDQAIAWLKRTPADALPVTVSTRDLRDVLNSSWFHARILDIYLWEHG